MMAEMVKDPFANECRYERHEIRQRTPAHPVPSLDVILSRQTQPLMPCLRCRPAVSPVQLLQKRMHREPNTPTYDSIPYEPRPRNMKKKRKKKKPLACPEHLKPNAPDDAMVGLASYMPTK